MLSLLRNLTPDHETLEEEAQTEIPRKDRKASREVLLRPVRGDDNTKKKLRRKKKGE